MCTQVDCMTPTQVKVIVLSHSTVLDIIVFGWNIFTKPHRVLSRPGRKGGGKVSCVLVGNLCERKQP